MPRKPAANVKPSQPPPNDFRGHSVMPKIADLFDPDGISGSGRVSFRQNIPESPYNNLDEYLSIYYHLVEEDFLNPLRQSIGNFLTFGADINQQIPNTDQQKKNYFYRNVRIKKDSFLLNQRVPDRPENWCSYSIKFDPPNDTYWKKNKHLIFGSLVALWNAANKLVLLAVVTHSEPKEVERGLLTLSFDLKPPVGFDNFTYTMLESPVFYEPYRVVMEAYQQMDSSNFPLSPYILGLNKVPGIPSYLENKQITLEKGKSFDLMDLQSWPSARRLGVNDMQRTALHAAMTRKVALIQGPPGTGKSFVGLKIISILLDNLNLWQGESNHQQTNREDLPDTRTPIVVICLTNHALDQFLDGLSKRTKRMIRIGSQSNSSRMTKYSMSSTKDSVYKREKTYRDTNFFLYSNKMKIISEDIKLLNEKLRIPGQFAEALENELKEKIEKYNLLKSRSEEALCRNVDVIGMTTTGAARRRQLLSFLQPKIGKKITAFIFFEFNVNGYLYFQF